MVYNEEHDLLGTPSSSELSFQLISDCGSNTGVDVDSLSQIQFTVSMMQKEVSFCRNQLYATSLKHDVDNRLVLQRVVRAFLARRRVLRLKEDTAAAAFLQKYARRFLAKLDMKARHKAAARIQAGVDTVEQYMPIADRQSCATVLKVRVASRHCVL